MAPRQRVMEVWWTRPEDRLKSGTFSTMKNENSFHRRMPSDWKSNRDANVAKLKALLILNYSPTGGTSLDSPEQRAFEEFVSRHSLKQISEVMQLLRSSRLPISSFEKHLSQSEEKSGASLLGFNQIVEGGMQ